MNRRVYVTNGPNDLWHADGYDKLKPFGFPIHGCIDGYSRKILWLKVIHSNNNPVVISRIFLDALKEHLGCPSRLRTDCGTENVLIATIQSFLRQRQCESYESAIACHIYGPSYANQRIEGWWSFFRRNRSSFFINFFKEMVDQGELNTDNEFDLACVRYCFGELLQKELDEVKLTWNVHYIRKSGYETVSGRPNELFYLPELKGVEDQLKPYDPANLEEIDNYVESLEEEEVEGSYCEFYEYFDYLMEFYNFQRNDDWEATLKSYRMLMRHKP